jgi:hypothetical protein
MGSEEGEEVQDIGNKVNKLIAENFPNIKNDSYPGAGSLKATK